MNAADLVAPITAAGGAVTLPDAPQWMQGRTLYGGASALVAYTAAIRAYPDLPPLRAAQIGFVAPVGGEIDITCEVVRRGRNVAQIRTSIQSEGQLALNAFWLFGESREANARHPVAPLADWPGPPEDAARVLEGKGPAFIQSNFEVRRAQGAGGDGAPVVRRWLKLHEPPGLDPIAHAILVGDALPPGSMRAMQRLGPISSINWSFNVLAPEPATRDGWWLAETASEWADHGYSSERLRLWNADGQMVLSGMQSVAVFG